jgi:hypothetical protein
MKNNKCCIDIGFLMKRKTPKIVREIIHDNKIIMKLGRARNW